MKKIIGLILLATTIGVPKLYAQQSVTASGGEASGSGGSASVSTGQVVYTTISGAGGVVTQGVQQPYEIFVLGKNEHKSILLNAIAYPNPTISQLALRIDSGVLPDLRYELYDLNGRVLSKNIIKDVETIIPVEQFPAATYILKVYSGRFEVKTFKIVKNSI